MATPSTFYTRDGNPFHPAMVVAYLCEQDDLNNRLLFHFNPTSYTFSKEATYESDLTHNDFVESLNHKTSKALEVNFELFLNELDAPRKIQRSVEDSIGWMMNRMSPTEKGAPRPSGWLDTASRAAANGSKQTSPAPVLILVGLRNIFTCVLTKVEVKSIAQRPNTLPSTNSASTTRAVQSQNADLATPTFNPSFSASTAAALARGQNLQPFPFRNGEGGFLGPSQKKPGDIIRATVNVSLKEFVPSPV